MTLRARKQKYAHQAQFSFKPILKSPHLTCHDVNRHHNNIPGKNGPLFCQQRRECDFHREKSAILGVPTRTAFIYASWRNQTHQSSLSLDNKMEIACSLTPCQEWDLSMLSGLSVIRSKYTMKAGLCVTDKRGHGREMFTPASSMSDRFLEWPQYFQAYELRKRVSLKNSWTKVHTTYSSINHHLCAGTSWCAPTSYCWSAQKKSAFRSKKRLTKLLFMIVTASFLTILPDSQ